MGAYAISTPSKKQRQIAKEIGKLKAAVANRDFPGFENHFLTTVDRDLLLAIREQKVLFQLAAHEVEKPIDIIREQAQIRFEGSELDEFEGYLRFTRLALETRAELSAKLSKTMRDLPSTLSIPSIIAAARACFDELVATATPRLLSPGNEETVANYEHRIHSINGRLNDYGFALLRAVNEIAKNATGQVTVGEAWKRRSQTLKTFRRIVLVVGELNAIDFIIDSVSYGKFQVDKIESASEIKIILKPADPRLDLIRTAGIRRGLILALHQHRAKRFVRDQLLSVQAAVITHAVRFFLDEVPSALAPKELSTAIDLGTKMLISVDAEDDLLYAAAPDKLQVASYYHATIALRWYSAARDLVERQQRPKLRRHISRLAIPLDAISGALRDPESRHHAEIALNAMTTALPVRNHVSLIRKPFVKQGPLCAIPVLPLDLGLWNLTVREELVDGGHLGKRLGKIWEDFYAHLLRDAEWQILGQGVRLKDGKDTVTDIDLLLLRNDLLLVVQIKALTGSDVSQYDHWKNRKIIEWGCVQAKLSSDYLRRHPQKLISVSNKKIAKQIRHIEPLVLTNSSLFDGWIYEGVSVAGEVMRNAISSGARIDYHDARNKEIVRTYHIVRKEDLTTDTILWLLRHPVELQALPDLVVRHVSVKFGTVTYEVPDLDLAPGEPVRRKQDYPARAEFE
ncbi:hypothetical protein QWJ46_04410 [Rhizobium sp. CBN3]|uniref:hypothetical protein n=1 Tax=Rhizobium sp. CBN3 TaxID=3058045 RepID=UPI002672028E|nr:hypothetical protein [Rhizobium sp. CBN3]MDO3431918.1 hypothetical protein [Rhizobium sp. CBN3]